MSDNTHSVWGDRLSPRVDEPDGPHTIAGDDGATVIGILKGLLFHTQNVQEFMDDAVEQLEAAKAALDILNGAGAYLYAASFSAVSVAAAQDFLSLLMPATHKAIIHYASVGQYTDFGDAEAEIISVKLIRGATVAGTGGAAVTPVPVLENNPVSQATVRRNDTTAATGGTTVISEVMNVAAGYVYDRPRAERIEVGPGRRFQINTVSTPADAFTANGTVIWEEIAV